jgi:hypothetical protein
LLKAGGRKEMGNPSQEVASSVKKKIPLWAIALSIGIVVCVVIAGLILTGQINLPGQVVSVAGTYVNEFNSNEFITLKEDGTFISKEKGIYFYGKWKIEGNMITLYAEKMESGGVEIPLGITEKATLQGETIIDDDGIRWIKQKQ